MKHWTQKTAADFAYNLSLDLFTQLQERLENTPISRKEYAERLDVDISRISQIFNDPPENPKLESLVKYARALGLKISVVAYDDGDPDNTLGPVYSGIFETCWKRVGAPRDFFQIHGDISPESTIVFENFKHVTGYEWRQDNSSTPSGTTRTEYLPQRAANGE